mmetsp:Transcript_4343/g.15279  ORF Transcript_4343/g.15279 Transcript_4343/m.15279 type:complete len:269 (-) Transcript_4343:276-1082(-)
MLYCSFSSKPARLSMMVTATSSMRSRRPSAPLKRYMLPLTSMTKWNFFLSSPAAAKWLCSTSVRCLYTAASPLSASARRVSSRSPAVWLRTHARSLPFRSMPWMMRRSWATWSWTCWRKCSYSAASCLPMSISRRRWASASSAIARARACTSAETLRFSSSDIWCTLWPLSSRYGPPLPPNPAVSAPPVPPAQVLPPTWGWLSGSSLPCLGEVASREFSCSTHISYFRASRYSGEFTTALSLPYSRTASSLMPRRSNTAEMSFLASLS